MNIHRMGFGVDRRDGALWPDREDLSIEFMRILAASQQGGASVAECLAVANRIDGSDDGWHREWSSIAEVNRERGNAARECGHLSTARSNWLRAVNYYQAAAFPLDPESADYVAAMIHMRQCARDYLALKTPRGEIVSIPWADGHPLEGYFVPANREAPAPVVVCVGDPGSRKEEYLYKFAGFAGERNISLLAVDLFGSDPRVPFEQVGGRLNPETSIRHIIDYIVGREDIDLARIAVVADSWGSSFVSRGLAFEDRVAAAVCDGGVWDLHERALLLDRDADPGAPSVHRLGLGVARNLQCPVLISTGEGGWLKPERVRELYKYLEEDGLDVTLKLFTSAETAAGQGHADNPTLANEYMFDWLAAKFDLVG